MEDTEADIDISNLFIINRFPNNWWKRFAILLYSPCGLVLAVLRLFILIQAYLATALLHENSVVRRTILRIISIVLGVVIWEEDRDQLKDSTRVFVSNHVTLFDHIPLHLVTGCITPSFPKLSLPLIWGLKDLGASQGKRAFKARLQDIIAENDFPILFHPEEETTSGKVALLEFSSWYGFAHSMQPVCLKVWRPPFADIAPNILQSSAIIDFFWFLFVPCTVYKITYLPVINRGPGDTNGNMIARLETAISNKLKLAKTAYNASDKAEYLKRYNTEVNLRRYFSYPPRPRRRNHKIHMDEMTAQVKEVLPHVPVDVIYRDLVITKHVDLTISNILEGRVDYVPIPSPDQVEHQEEVNIRPSTSRHPQLPNPGPNIQPNVSFPKSAQERMLSLVDRKKNMIETARKKYMERHGLNSL